jgi:hypothetical protein
MHMMHNAFLTLFGLMASLQVAQGALTTKDPTVGPEFGYVLAVVACITMQLTLTILSAAGPRYKYLTKDFIAKNLQKENGLLSPSPASLFTSFPAAIASVWWCDRTTF